MKIFDLCLFARNNLDREELMKRDDLANLSPSIPYFGARATKVTLENF